MRKSDGERKRRFRAWCSNPLRRRGGARKDHADTVELIGHDCGAFALAVEGLFEENDKLVIEIALGGTGEG